MYGLQLLQLVEKSDKHHFRIGRALDPVAQTLWQSGKQLLSDLSKLLHGAIVRKRPFSGDKRMHIGDIGLSDRGKPDMGEYKLRFERTRHSKKPLALLRGE